jgi:hypothetical protein
MKHTKQEREQFIKELAFLLYMKVCWPYQEGEVEYKPFLAKSHHMPKFIKTAELAYEKVTQFNAQKSPETETGEGE